MTESMTDATHDLTHPFTDVVRTDDPKAPYKPVDHEPLLVTLRKAVRASLGGTTDGGIPGDVSARSLLNGQAFMLWEQIERDVQQATRTHLRDRPNPMLGYAVRQLAEHVDALWNTTQITEPDYLWLIRKAKGWKRSIWELLDPPVEKELIGACPRCEQEKITNQDGELVSALIAYYRKGLEPVARCRHCGEVWQGEGQLVILGRLIGAELDTDTLTEMGIASV